MPINSLPLVSGCGESSGIRPHFSCSEADVVDSREGVGRSGWLRDLVSVPHDPRSTWGLLQPPLAPYFTLICRAASVYFHISSSLEGRQLFPFHRCRKLRPTEGSNKPRNEAGAWDSSLRPGPGAAMLSLPSPYSLLPPPPPPSPTPPHFFLSSCPSAPPPSSPLSTSPVTVCSFLFCSSAASEAL